MVMHPLVRLPDLINALGLMFTALGIYFVGSQLKRKLIMIIGLIGLAIFMNSFLLFFYLFCRDYFALLPTFTRKFLGIPF